MISKRIQFLKEFAFRGELLEVINQWDDDIEFGVANEQERLKLVDMLFTYLTGQIK